MGSINDYVLMDDGRNFKSNMDDIVTNIAYLNEMKTSTAASTETTMFVERRQDGEQFVLKRITPDSFSKSFARLEIALQEAETLLGLNHINIVQVHQAFQDNGHLFIVVEFVDGGNLATLIKQQTGILFSEDIIVGWFRQMVQGVRYLHSKYVIHGNIKPQNILLSSNHKTLRLCDYGLSKVFDSVGLSFLARPGYSSSQLYAAPECAELIDQNDIDRFLNGTRDDEGAAYPNDDIFSAGEKADVWSMGVVIYEVASLKRPFTSIRAMMTREPDPMPGSYSSELRSTVLKMLAKYPWNRIDVVQLAKEPIFVVKKILKPRDSLKTPSAVTKKSEKTLEVNYTPEEFEDLQAVLSKGVDDGDVTAVDRALQEAKARSELMLRRLLDFSRNQLGDTLLHRAARKGQHDVVRALCEAGADTENVNKDLEQPLHVACVEGHEKVVEVLAEHTEEGKIDAKGPRGRTGLAMAAANGHADVVSVLLNSGANSEEKSSDEDFELTPLHLAAFFGHVPTIKVLVDGGASLTARDKNQDQPIHAAARNGQRLAVEALIDLGARPESSGYRGRTAFHHAIHGGFVDVVEGLLLRGVDVNSRSREDKHQRPPLHVAVLRRNLAIIELLIKYRANLQEPDADGDTALHLAVSHGFASVVEMLLDQGMSMESENKLNGYTPLHMAAISGHRNCLTLLLRRGTFIEATSSMSTKQQTPLHLAVINCQVEAGRALIQSGADVEAMDADGHAPLALAVIHDRSPMIRLLVETFGANVDSRRSSTEQNTPLHLACRLGRYEAAKALLQQMAVLELKNQLGLTPFGEAVANGHVICAELLWSWGASTETPGNDSNLPIHLAALRNDEEMLKFLVARARVNVDAPGQGLRTALQACCHAGLEGAVLTLARLGANVNVKTGADVAQTPLQIACVSGFSGICRELVKAKANPNVLNRLGETALMLACQENKPECVKVLLQEGKADFELFGREGRRALHYAVGANSVGSVKMLLEAGAGLKDMPEEANKETAFHMAARLGCVEIGRAMLTKQPSLVDQVNVHGQTALHVAADNGQLDFVKMLLDKSSPTAPVIITRKDLSGSTALDLASRRSSATTNDDGDDKAELTKKIVALLAQKVEQQPSSSASSRRSPQVKQQVKQQEPAIDRR